MDTVSVTLSFSVLAGMYVQVMAGDALSSKAPAQSWAAHVNRGVPQTPPGPESVTWTRASHGQHAEVSIRESDGSVATARFISQMKEAVDACLATAPTYEIPPPPKDDPAWATACAQGSAQQGEPDVQRCIDAERAIRDIEAMCGYQSEAIGDGGDLGDTFAALQHILALGASATPYLVRLAHSRNPVARIAAIDGFLRVRGDVATRELVRLSADRGKAPAAFGCDFGTWRVGDLASDALGRPR